MLSKLIKAYVRFVDRMNEAVGNVIMFLIFALLGIMIFDVVSRTFFNKPNIWTVEMSEFTMTTYYMLGGAYTLIRKGHVRMDLFYDRWTGRGKAVADILTFPLVLLYMVIFLIGSITSLWYAITHHQVTYSSWAPPLTPIKLIMTIGILLMTMQVIAEFFKDLETMRGRSTR